MSFNTRRLEPRLNSSPRLNHRLNPSLHASKDHCYDATDVSDRKGTDDPVHGGAEEDEVGQR